MPDSTATQPNWIDINEVSILMNRSIKTIKNLCYLGKLNYRVEINNNKYNYFINTKSLPDYAKIRYFGDKAESENKYSEAPEWAKVLAEKYIIPLKESENLKGKKLQKYIDTWNSDISNQKLSYNSILRMRRRYNEEGISGLLAKYGNNAYKTKVSDEYFDYFKALYLVEGAPSLQSCWDLTYGYAKREHGAVKSEFPSRMAFLRRLEREIPKQSIYLARYGESAWNKKYGYYVERDYENIICGKVWVSDHAQIDVACMTSDGNVVFPWVTAWRDFKSGKWLGWILQTGHPNSDHIFQTFYYAAESYGLPEDIIIDNGKDYRCKDFAGGRKRIKITADESKTSSMLDELGVRVSFALPYNAQTKPIERDFLKIKEMISKHCVGYRGGNVTERPEKLAAEIKAGKILPFEKFKAVFDDFIINVLNKKPSQGKNHNGMPPNEVFNQEFTEKVVVSNDALKLFCMRTSKTSTVGRNGIKDREFGITYWADWMIARIGLKVYLRRDPVNYKTAWAFRADNDEYVGNVSAVQAVAALHADEISKEEFKTALSNKKRNLKVAKAYIQQTREISLEEQCENYKAAYASVEREKVKPKVSKIANTNMDKAVRKNKEQQMFGKQDLSMFLDERTKDEPLYLFETDKILEEELKGAVNGY